MHKTFTITRVRRDNERTQTLIFDAALDAQPGQYVMAWLPGVGERPFSLAGTDPLALTVVAVGPFSRALHQRGVGQRVWIRGPLGQGFALRAQRAQRVLLVGGGYGVAPLLLLAREARAAGRAVEVCIGARSAGDVLLADAFAEAGCAVRVTTEDGSRGTRGLVTQAVAAAVAAQRPGDVCACGPVPMLVALAQLCRERALPHQLSWEARLRCGMGLCGDCELDAASRRAARVPAGWLVCKDGPVFRYDASSAR